MDRQDAMTNNISLTRRDFARTVSAGVLTAFGVGVPTSAFSRVHDTALRVAVIGAGARGAQCVTALAACDGVDVFVHDADARRGMAVAEGTGTTFLPEAAHCIEAPDISGVVLATSATTAAALCNGALKNKKRVFWDCSDSSAVGISLDSVRDAATNDVTVLFPHGGLAASARAAIAEGRIGTVRHVHSSVDGCACGNARDGVAETHQAHLLLLLEVLGDTHGACRHDVLASGDADRFETMMTTITWQTGCRMEVTTTRAPLESTGCVIHGSSGSIRIEHDHTLVIAPDGAVHQYPDPLETVRMRRLRAWAENSEDVPAFHRRLELTASILDEARARMG